MKVYKDDKEIKLEQALSELKIRKKDFLIEINEDGLIRLEKNWKGHVYMFIPE